MSEQSTSGSKRRFHKEALDDNLIFELNPGTNYNIPSTPVPEDDPVGFTRGNQVGETVSE
ncbi:hypothetical protein J6590_098862 [Homalodisca vitripennis]|nr:hypothetical protein J6590_098862 [Homalodisca vitripennis]